MTGHGRLPILGFSRQFVRERPSAPARRSSGDAGCAATTPRRRSARAKLGANQDLVRRNHRVMPDGLNRAMGTRSTQLFAQRTRNPNWNWTC